MNKVLTEISKTRHIGLDVGLELKPGSRLRLRSDFDVGLIPTKPENLEGFFSLR